MSRKTTIERAYELAQAGDYPDLYALERALKQEGRSDVRAQISGRQIRKTLMQLCRETWSGAERTVPDQDHQSAPA